MYILWIDPWTSTIWYALVQKSAGSIELVDYGVLHTAPKIDQTQKLLEIAEDITQLLEKYSPQRVGIEKLYFNTNITTGIAVAEARGVISYICIKKRNWNTWIHTSSSKKGYYRKWTGKEIAAPACDSDVILTLWYSQTRWCSGCNRNCIYERFKKLKKREYSLFF